MDFDDYMEKEFSLWEIKVRVDASNDNWHRQKILCDCPKFQKNFICKHSMGIAVLCKFATVPQDAKYDLTHIGKLPKGGRPPKATKALVM